MIKLSDFQPAFSVDYEVRGEDHLTMENPVSEMYLTNVLKTMQNRFNTDTEGNSANIQRFFDVRSVGASHKAGTSKDELFINTTSDALPILSLASAIDICAKP